MILTVGCSFTYGEGLADSSKTAWPALVSDYLNKPVKNLGIRGGSNEYIFRTAIEETILNKYDIVIIQWSSIDRSEVWHNETNKPLNFNPHTAVDQNWIIEYYAKFYDEKFAFKNWIIKIIALQKYFESIGQKYIQMSISEYNMINHTNFDTLVSNIDKKTFLSWSKEGLTNWVGKHTVSPTDKHPSEEGHKLIADKINEHIRNLGWIS